MVSKPKILSIYRLPDAVEARLASDYDWQRVSDDWLAFAQTYQPQALIVTPRLRVDRALLENLPPSVTMIGTFSVGYEHIDLAACADRGIKISNTPGVLTEATADITWLLILGATRLARPATEELLSGQWTGLAPTQFLGLGLQNKHLGILGFGRIGQAVARRALPFGLKLHVFTRTRPTDGSEIPFQWHKDLKTFLSACDLVSIHCPLTPQTRHLINQETIQSMRKGAVLINSARGSVVDDHAVLAALASGQLSSVGLDVFENEPNIHPGYLAEKRAFILPHLGSATIETRNAMGMKVLDNLDAYFAGRPLLDELKHG